MALKSLKRPKKTHLRDSMVKECDIDEEPYPYGTRLNLDQRSMQALKMNIEDFEIGEIVMVMGRAEVVSMSQRASKDSDNQDMSLQITDMDVKTIGGLSLMALKLAGNEE